jgi:hypothetical protein
MLDSNGANVGQLEGTLDGRKVRLVRRWSGGTQTYDLTLDSTSNRMNGTFEGTRDTSVSNDAQLERENPVATPAPQPTPERAVASVSGRWTITSGSGRYRGVVVLQQSGVRLVGTMLDSNGAEVGRLEGTVDGRRVRLVRRWPGGTQSYELTLDGTLNRMSGTFDGARDTTVGNDAQLEREHGSAAPTPLAVSLTGPWVHSADPNARTEDSRVIVVHETKGNEVTMTHAWKTGGRWVTAICQGPLAGHELRMECRFAAGGNPLGFAAFSLHLQLSADGNHLDGSIVNPVPARQESHYSRIP